MILLPMISHRKYIAIELDDTHQFQAIGFKALLN